MPNGRGWAYGFQLDWQTLIMTVGVILIMVGGFWTLAYIPIQGSIKDLKEQINDLRSADIRNAENFDKKFITRHEFAAELKRMDQADLDSMKRREFDAWKMERDKTIAAIQDRQNRFTEALDSMYSKIMQQQPTYVPRQ